MLIRDVGFFAAQTSYAANPVNFDGTDDYLTRGATLTGAADSKLLTASLWARRVVATGDQNIFRGTSFGNISFRNDNSRMQFVFVEAGTSTVRLNITSSATTDFVWHHYMMSVDMSNVAKRHVYKDDASVILVTTYTDATLDLTQTNWAVGATPGAIGKVSADLADLQVWFGSYIDLSVEANRRLFITATGNPVDPAVAAASPLGSPIVCLSGPTASWHTNDGTGGGFTVTGALSDGTGPVEF